MQRFENELPKSVLKLIIKEIDKEVNEYDISWTDDDVYKTADQQQNGQQPQNVQQPAQQPTAPPAPAA